MDSGDILQLLKDASANLNFDEILLFDDFSKYSEENQINKGDLFSIKNAKNTFGANLAKAKHIGYSKSISKPIYIESTLSSILRNNSAYQVKNGKVIYHRVPNAASLTLKQIRNIITRLLISQYDVFDGYSVYQSFFNCVYLFKDFYAESESQNPLNPKFLKMKLLKTGIKLFLLTFFKTQCLANEIYTPSAIFSNEWSSFDFNEEEKNFDHEFIIEKNSIKEFIKAEKSKEKSGKSQINKSDGLLREIDSEIEELKSLSSQEILQNGLKNPLHSDYAIQTLKIIQFERIITDYFFKETFDQNSKEIVKELLPEFIDDLEENTPGFCVLNYPENGLKLNSDIKNYNDLKIKYSIMLDDFEYINLFFANSPKPTKIEELTDIFIEWGSTHCESITMVRFYFFRKYVPNFNNDDWQLNVYRPNIDSNPQKFEIFVSEIFEKVKKIPPTHKVKMIKLYGKFFSYCMRILIFRPYKLQKSLLKTVIIQWVRNIWQIYQFDITADQKVFKARDIKNMCFMILHADFKYYITYSFLVNILEMGNIKDMMFLYSFLFINLILLPFYKDRNKVIEKFLINDDIETDGGFKGDRFMEIRCFKCCFDLLFYQYVHSENERSKKDLLRSFWTYFFIIQKNVKKEYKLRTGKVDANDFTNEFNIDEVYDEYKKYLNNWFDKRTNYKTFSEHLEKSLKFLNDNRKEVKGQIKVKYFDLFMDIFQDKDNEISVFRRFLADPLKFRFEFISAACPYAIIKEKP